MGFKCGLVGLPNVGKSTLFNALTNLNVAAKNYPFCTVKPNFGVVPIFDMRLKKLAEIVKTESIIPTYMEFVDIAGLVKGAFKGEGLGNKFLSNIRKTDAIAHVVRCFHDNNIIHISNKINPIDDIQLVNTELVLSDIEVCEKNISSIGKRFKKKSFNLNKDTEKILSLLNICLKNLQRGISLRHCKFDDKEKRLLQSFNFITLKPIMYILNLGCQDKVESNVLELINFIKLDSKEIILIKILEEYLKISNKLHCVSNRLETFKTYSDNLYKIIISGYKKLNLETFFTVGKKEIRAWTIRKGSTALDASRKIHTDFQKGFIRAKVVSYVDFINHKGEIGSKKFGKYRNEGKTYQVKDGDIINFLFNV